MTAGNHHLPIASPPASSAGWRAGGGWNPGGGPWDDDARGHLALWARRQAGATIRGVLGTQTGAGGAVDVEDGVTQAVAPWGQYYYHYNDLGTVYATTTAAGAKLGVYDPDHYSYEDPDVTTAIKRIADWIKR